MAYPKPSIFAGAVARLKAGEKAEAVLDERFVMAFTVAGDAEDCRTHAEPTPPPASRSWR